MLTLMSAVAQQAPPARDFGRMLWSNTRGIFSTENIVPTVVGITATGSSALLDQKVQNYFGGERVAPAIGNIGNVLGSTLTLGAASGAMFFASYHGKNERFKAMSFDLAQGLALDTAITLGVKAAVGRERPDASNQYSFYSGHASASTTVATVVAHYYPKASIPAILFAGFVGFSRIEKNRHWLSDVIAGHAVGFILGRTVVRGHNPLKFGRLDLAPGIAPGGGIMINARINLNSGQ